MIIKPLLTAFCCFLLLSCSSETEKKIKDNIAYEYYSDGTIKSETEVKDTLAHGLMKQYDRDGNISSVYTFNMAKLEGPAVSYYPSGQLKLKMYYKNGKREGTTQWYYSTGELYRTIPYKNGKVDGTQITYFKNGKIMAEAPFRENMPGLGLREYNSKGELLKDDIEVVIREENRLFAENKFVLHLSLSKPQSGADFYMGELVEGKYIDPLQWQLPGKDGEASYIITLNKGGFRMETLILTASYKTSKSNYNVISRTYKLAIDNK
jgi:hypothetical protein